MLTIKNKWENCVLWAVYICASVQVEIVCSEINIFIFLLLDAGIGASKVDLIYQLSARKAMFIQTSDIN